MITPMRSILLPRRLFIVVAFRVTISSVAQQCVAAAGNVYPPTLVSYGGTRANGAKKSIALFVRACVPHSHTNSPYASLACASVANGV